MARLLVRRVVHPSPERTRALHFAFPALVGRQTFLGRVCVERIHVLRPIPFALTLRVLAEPVERGVKGGNLQVKIIACKPANNGGKELGI